MGGDPEAPVRFTRGELERRRRAVMDAAERRGCDGFVSFSAATIQWLTQYAFVPNERPFAVHLDAGGVLTLLAPLLKSHHATLDAKVDRIETYREYPGDIHPLRRLADFVVRKPSNRLLLESAGYSSPHGYHGPALVDLLSDIACHVDAHAVERLRMVKSAEEIAVLRHSCRWALDAHRGLQQAVGAGKRESAVAGAATGAAMRALLERYGSEPEIARPMRVFAGFGGQVGPDGTAHHAPRVLDPVLAPGDLLVTQVGAFIAGYYADVERTMVVGEPSPAARDLFLRGIEIQDYALGLIRPGRSCAAIDLAVWRRFQDRGIEALWRHHVGHSLGILVREAPYLDRGDPTVLEPGMVVTVEPGLYQDGVGGFRHSDCVLVTDEAAEILTPYPRDLDSLCCR